MAQENVIREGPIDGSVLGAHQEYHCSHSIWQNSGEPLVDCEPVVIRRNEATLKSANGALAAGDSLVPLGHRRVDYYFVGRGGFAGGTC
ncbi:hypothetical protein RHMOL_Rhmol11G0014900 [Rhododendron molle]|uniref:Uncharacterized protein n=1 Tax=Rhododendron molle TaxID=49168 RepID=A0ACC0LMY2_RHOML|nr:hypothetical protein RHMOL_Rhmol11G0014900 [Rhododendron molle]